LFRRRDIDLLQLQLPYQALHKALSSRYDQSFDLAFPITFIPTLSVIADSLRLVEYVHSHIGPIGLPVGLYVLQATHFHALTQAISPFDWSIVSVTSSPPLKGQGFLLRQSGLLQTST
jgi:hypothetical protein